MGGGVETNIYSHAMCAEPVVVPLLRRASRIALSKGSFQADGSVVY